MDLRRGWQYEYERSRGAGGGYGTPASFPAVPSLSTGQGFYTVESLQGATMLSPPQPVPSTTRVLPPLAPYARDFLPSPVLHSAHRGDFGPHERRYPTLPVVSRDLMTAPPQDMPYTRHGDGLHSPDIPPHRLPPPFMGDSRLPGVSPGRNEGQEPVSYTGQGPPPGRWMNSLGEPLVRTEKKKKSMSSKKKKKLQIRERRAAKAAKLAAQGKSFKKDASQSNFTSKNAAADGRFAADKQIPVEGGPGWCTLCKRDRITADSLNMHIAGKRHKRRVESQA